MYILPLIDQIYELLNENNENKTNIDYDNSNFELGQLQIIANKFIQNYQTLNTFKNLKIDNLNQENLSQLIDYIISQKILLECKIYNYNTSLETKFGEDTYLYFEIKEKIKNINITGILRLYKIKNRKLSLYDKLFNDAVFCQTHKCWKIKYDQDNYIHIILRPAMGYNIIN